MTKEINDLRSEIKQEENHCNEIFWMWLNNTTSQQIMLLFKQQNFTGSHSNTAGGSSAPETGSYGYSQKLRLFNFYAYLLT